MKRFWRGLNNDLRRELALCGITTLDQAYTLVQDYELVTKFQFSRPTDTRNITTKSQPSTNNFMLRPPSLKPNPNSAPLVKDNKGKGIASETPKLHSTVQCFKCQGFDHVASNCANKALVIDGQEYASKEEGLEKLIYEPNLNEFEDLDDDCLGDPNHLDCIRATSFQIGQPVSGVHIPKVGVV
jgi:hypothetical protein